MDAMAIVAVADPDTPFAPKVPVMPAGQADVTKVTAELNPFKALTVTVDVVVEPAVPVAGDALSRKLGSAGAVPEVVKL